MTAGGIPDPAAWAASLDELSASTERLLETVRGMTDADARAPSQLPGWTRGHVLTHLARNADGLANLQEWARTGEERPMYASKEARAADIERGAGRGLGDLELDLNDSAERLLGGFADFPAEAQRRVVRMRDGAEVAGWELPLLRIREVEIHHVDLGSSYTAAHWSDAFVARTLDQVTPLFRHERDCPVGSLRAVDLDRAWRVAADGPELSGQASGLLAWLTGRSDGDGLTLEGSAADAPIPRAPAWA